MPKKEVERGFFYGKATKKTIQRTIPYAILLVGLGLVSFFTRTYLPELEGFLLGTGEAYVYITIAVLLIFGYAINRIAQKTLLPSFVWAIFFGVALQPFLFLLVQQGSIVAIIVQILAAMILFGGGIEVPFNSFKKFFLPITTLAVFGALVMAFGFSFFLDTVTPYFGVAVPIGAVLLIGAILVSTDPAAIIPSLRALKFKKPRMKEMAVSESAINDVVGTILTRVFLLAVIGTGASLTLFDHYKAFFHRETIEELILDVAFGLLFGLIGYQILKAWTKFRKKDEELLDPSLFLAVPIFVFALGTIFGGSGYLGAFFAGLLFETDTRSHKVREFFETFLDGFAKPIIFIMLGAIVPLEIVMQAAPLGILSAAVFMFVLRPIVVFLSLSPWLFAKKNKFSIKELAFMSFVRETGVIPAVMILVVAGSGIEGADFLFAIGMWVILATLIIQPPLTPWWAKKLGIATDA